MCSQRSRKIHTVVPLPCPDFELFVGDLEVGLLDTEPWYSKMEVAGDIISSGNESKSKSKYVFVGDIQEGHPLTLKH